MTYALEGGSLQTKNISTMVKEPKVVAATKVLKTEAINRLKDVDAR